MKDYHKNKELLYINPIPDGGSKKGSQPVFSQLLLQT